MQDYIDYTHCLKISYIICIVNVLVCVIICILELYNLYMKTYKGTYIFMAKNNQFII